ncbi:uncharacterized protein [Clytia hemisphaerica]|uniref:Uncharacterized protein n=1 Tax=Clytia hemisphaerica TaxID=252671 RepID=A0A7M5V7L5_9CNID
MIQAEQSFSPFLGAEDINENPYSNLDELKREVFNLQQQQSSPSQNKDHIHFEGQNENQGSDISSSPSGSRKRKGFTNAPSGTSNTDSASISDGIVSRQLNKSRDGSTPVKSPRLTQRHPSVTPLKAMENSIVKWAKEEKELVGLKETLLNNTVDFGDYSILMYETQDAFNHCRNLRLQLQIAEQQVRLKTKQCSALMEQRAQLKRIAIDQKRINDTQSSTLEEKLRKTEQKMIDIYGENEWLHGKYEEMKMLCIKYRDRYLTASQHERIDYALNETRDRVHLDGSDDDDGSEVRGGVTSVLSEDSEKRQPHFNTPEKFPPPPSPIPKEQTFMPMERNGQRGVEPEKIQGKRAIDPEQTFFVPGHDFPPPPGGFGNYTGMNERRHFDERPRKGQFKAESPLRDVPIDDLGIQRTIREIKTIAARNDHKLLALSEKCQSAFTGHTEKVAKICNESQVVADKLERWMENYMILKRRTEETSEIYQRELKKSWSAEIEYSKQIKALCETINDMSQELVDGKQNLGSYEKHFDKVTKVVKEMEEKMENLVRVSSFKQTMNESKLKELKNHVTQLKEIRLDGKKKKGTPSTGNKRTTKTLFNLKRRLSETNESGKSPGTSLP